jgi:hypothetical protein
MSSWPGTRGTFTVSCALGRRQLRSVPKLSTVQSVMDVLSSPAARNFPDYPYTRDLTWKSQDWESFTKPGIQSQLRV